MPEQPQMSEEQVAELQEKIKNMSPEELKAFQKKQCIFCHIIEGKVQSKKIYEDDKCIAILDINPANPGHILLLPKEHYSIMPQVPPEEIAHLFMISKTLSNAALRGLGVQGTNIIVQNGIAAGQKAQHFMVHIIPRKEKDDLNFEIPQKKMSEKELESVRKQLSEKLGGVKEQKTEAPPDIKDIIKSKDEVVEAEFEEKEEQKIKDFPTSSSKEAEEPEKEEPQEEEKPKEKQVNNEKPKKSTSKSTTKQSAKKKTEDVGLDDIANILGVK